MKIAIIGAMEEEVHVLRDKLDNLRKEEVAGSEYNIGTYEGKEVILLRSGIGKVNAAMATAILLEKYQPDVVINTGSAGGLHTDLNVGDVVISTEVRHHDVDVTAFNYEYGQVPGMPAAFLSDDKLKSIAKKCAEKINGIQVVEGLIVTGDSFMNDPVRVDFVKEKFGDLYAVEMEAAAIAQVCYAFKVPFVVTRALSDIAGKESNISFDQFIHTAAVNSTLMVEEMIKAL
ncbi:5'-methylthioadenosine/S-adenosylhomocysteine nucleosidase [Gottfriedia sp. NPDC057991]|uniref:5'-methylthioadenosine/S-adenosylhomocysteine nucleosidase n=1 Tax=Gottfriedia sp. NPDC057991 TaxID=3346298 RepID=UPI0036D77FC0